MTRGGELPSAPAVVCALALLACACARPAPSAPPPQSKPAPQTPAVAPLGHGDTGKTDKADKADKPDKTDKTAPPRRLSVLKRRRGKRVSRSDLLAIYEGWFKRPYPYMFRGGTKLAIGGRTLGVFMAGVKGIMLYGGLSGAIAAHKGYRRGGFYNTHPVELLAGLKVYAKRSQSLQRISRINVGIVRWGYENLIPDPNDRIHGVRAQEIYQRIFSRFFRLMSASYRYVSGRPGGIAAERKAYRAAMDAGNFRALSWLRSRYRGVLSRFHASNNSSNFTVPMAMGFWVRRSMDGTASELSRGLAKLMNLYDRAWWQQHGKP